MAKRNKFGRFIKGSSGFTGKHSKESKQKMSVSQRKNPTRYWLGKKRSPETIKKISDSLKGRQSWNKGLPRTWSSLGDFKKGHNPVHKGKTYEEAYGIKKANELKEKLSKTHTERPNRYWKGKDRPEISGINSRCWKGGYNKYYGRNWLSQRLKVLKRDNKTCQDCGCKEKIVVHHIKPVRQFWIEYKQNNQRTKLKRGEIIDLLHKEINSLSNLITLCESKNNCHKKWENGKNKSK